MIIISDVRMPGTLLNTLLAVTPHTYIHTYIQLAQSGSATRRSDSK